jgi:hypothetical protein
VWDQPGSTTDDFHPSVASYSLSQGRQLTWSRNTQLTLHVRGHVCIHCSVCPVRHHLEPHPPPSPPRRASCTPPHSSSTLLPSQPRTPVSARPQHRSMSPQPWPARRWIGFIRDTGTRYSQQGPGGAGKGEWVGGCSHRVDATDPGSPSRCCGGESDHITQHHIMGVLLLPRPSQVPQHASSGIPTPLRRDVWLKGRVHQSVSHHHPGTAAVYNHQHTCLEARG